MKKALKPLCERLTDVIKNSNTVSHSIPFTAYTKSMLNIMNQYL